MEIVAAGPEADVGDLIARCHTGSPAANVAKVIVSEEDGEVASGFRQISTL